MTWSETGINWNNRPTTGTTTLDTENVAYNGDVDQWHDWDVSAYVAAQKAAGATLVTLALKAGNVTDSKASFNSDEAASNQPQLVLTPSPSFQADSTGLVSMEAENKSGTLSQGGKSWTSYTTTTGYSGAGALQATANTGVSNSAATALGSSPRLDYAIDFPDSGTYYVWLRAHGGTTNDDSVHVGLDGVIPSTGQDYGGFTASGYAWDNTATSGSVVMVSVPSAGVHTFSVWMREDGTVVDKIILTPSGSYTPSGTGPSETPYNAAPTIATAASASPSTVTGTTTTLSVLGADDGGESGLTYSWIAPPPCRGTHPFRLSAPTAPTPPRAPR